MNILITNIWLVNYAGTEVYVRDLAIALKNRGIHVEVYSPDLGTVAAEIREAGILVTDSTEELVNKPDLIHAHHFIPTMDVIVRFPDTGVIYFLHDRTNIVDTPPKHRNIVKYMAVDYNCIDRLVIDNNIPVESTGVLYNWVDTSRFKLRETIHQKPKKALVFSNTANVDNYYKTIKEACLRLGITADGIGLSLESSVAHPEKVLNEYDIVFAKAKAAMEALSTGAGVIVCDIRGLGGMVSTENYEYFRKYNFGMKTLTRPITPELILEEIKKYDQTECRITAEFIRKDADLNLYVDTLLVHYNAAIKEFSERKRKMNSYEEERTIQEYLFQKKAIFLSKIKEVEQQKTTIAELNGKISKQNTGLAELQEENNRQKAEIDQLHLYLQICENSLIKKLSRFVRNPAKFLAKFYKA